MKTGVLHIATVLLATLLAVPAAQAAEKTIAWVPPAMISPYYAYTIEGARAEAKKQGFNLRVVSPERETDYAGQVRIVEDMVTEKVDGIGLCAINADAISAAVRKANEANIPVIVFNSLSELPNCDVAAYVGFDQQACGRTILDFVAKRLNGTGNVAVIEGLPGYHSNERMAGIRKENEKHPGIKIVATQPGDFEREKAMNAAQNMLVSHPEIQAIIGLSDEMALGAVQAARDAGRNDLIIVGNDGNPSAIDSIKEGRLTGSCYTFPAVIGAKTVSAFKELFDKGSTAKFTQVDLAVISLENLDKMNAPQAE